MFLRVLLAFCLFSSVACVTKVICQQYCASIQETSAYNNCSPWNSYLYDVTNFTCYNKCVYNCYNVYDGACMSDNNFRCCFKTIPAKTQEFKRTGCNKIYNNLPGWWE